mmetsp:Transcript_7062/g.26751  ORF Transcript_7062/g.26751 Transcript_7062/m.26751 type:complete len:220 (+) Transcript_7062:1338-1997(+)
MVNTPGVLFARKSVFRHVRSTAAKRLPSSGSCSMISSLPKMGSKYIHARWNTSHSSSTSLVIPKVRSHSRIFASNGFLNGENDIACVITMWSSSACVIASSTRITQVSVSRYSTTSSTIPSHSETILSIACSMAYSFPATSETLNILSCVCVSNAPVSTRVSREKTDVICTSSSVLVLGSVLVLSSVPGTFSPVSDEILSQCRWRMPGDRSAKQSGTYF